MHNPEDNLYHAVKNGNVRLAESLIASRRYDIERRYEDGNTVLDIAVDRGDIQMAKLLLSEGAKPNIADDGNYTPLHSAIINRNLEMVELLLNYGASVELKDGLGTTALMLAVKFGEPEILKAILKKNPNLEAADNFGRTALFMAATNFNDTPVEEDIIKTLVKAGADKSTKNEDGNTIFQVISKKYKPGTANKIVSCLNNK